MKRRGEEGKRGRGEEGKRNLWRVSTIRYHVVSTQINNELALLEGGCSILTFLLHCNVVGSLTAGKIESQFMPPASYSSLWYQE